MWGERDRGKRLEMTSAACAGADSTIATADNPRGECLRSIFDDMKKEFLRGQRLSLLRIEEGHKQGAR